MRPKHAIWIVLGVSGAAMFVMLIIGYEHRTIMEEGYAKDCSGVDGTYIGEFLPAHAHDIWYSLARRTMALHLTFHVSEEDFLA
jgi:hypothetical protein